MNLLFHEAAVVAPLASGSRGNCTYVGDERRGVLIDCGLSTRQILSRLDAVGLGHVRIEGVLVTHEHTDHVGAARVLSRRLEAREGRRVPFYMTQGTATGLHPSCRPDDVHLIEAGGAFEVALGLTVEPVTVPHDTRDPVSYTLTVGGVRVGVITDLGRSTKLVEQQLATLDVAVLEFNHDLTMLLEGSYPWYLKQRVRGPHGHLSNQQASDIVARAGGTRLRHLVLAHLSEENNRPELALAAAHQGLHAAGLRRVRVHVAHQHEPMEPVRAPPSPGAAAAPRRPASAPAEADDADRQIGLFSKAACPPAREPGGADGGYSASSGAGGSSERESAGTHP